VAVGTYIETNSSQAFNRKGLYITYSIYTQQKH
jgi:hypothetical protein